MLLTTKGRYAVMALVDMATRESDKPITIASIAQRQEIDEGYLEQLFAKLKKMGLVIATKGPGGGYKLSRSKNDISIVDIMTAVEESMEMTRCGSKPGTGCLSNKSRCFTHHLWEDLGDYIYKYLRSVTLEDVCQKRLNNCNKMQSQIGI